jgi:hypothetical protein
VRDTATGGTGPAGGPTAARWRAPSPHERFPAASNVSPFRGWNETSRPMSMVCSGLVPAALVGGAPREV